MQEAETFSEQKAGESEAEKRAMRDRPESQVGKTEIKWTW